ncbi:hypothetical protein U0070_013815 [Myodes glareolus]|uniref:UDP-D-xylose:beta-D-glucoside alpha-1,3-D-xylosyltransferase n=1 Tax=Myodes glareolus TaxID=447135 RepID=A0AAW0HMQ7_MYOGA
MEPLREKPSNSLVSADDPTGMEPPREKPSNSLVSADDRTGLEPLREKPSNSLVSADDPTGLKPLREKPSSGYHPTLSPNKSVISPKQLALATSLSSSCALPIAAVSSHPVILKDVDSLLYVDTDVLFLRPVDDIWKLLRQFNSTQLAAMAPEHEIPKIGWYSRFARHPFYGSTGVNSGVMLMNLTRIRSTQFKNSLIPTGLAWEDMLLPLYQKYKNAITWGDQDLLNIIFYFNPGIVLSSYIINNGCPFHQRSQNLSKYECLYVFPCQWNYRPDHCMYGSNCKEAEREGVSVLHGNRGVYHDDKQPTFRALYEAIRDFPFQDNLFQSMYYPLQLKFLETVHTLCGRIPQVFLKQIEKTMRRAYEKHVIIHMGPNSMS